MKSAMLKLLTLVVLSAMLAGCAATYGYHATNNPTGDKVGQACTSNVLGLISTGDASVQAAAEDGDITNVATVDVVGESGLIAGEVCTTVTGE